MVTEISAVGLGHSVVAQSGMVTVPRVSEMSRSVQADSVLPILRDQQASSAVQVAGAFSALRSRQESLNEAAATVREVSKATEKAGQFLGKMVENLTTLVKIYPPYPLDSPERIDLLNGFGGLRRQIEALTFPKPRLLDAVDQFIDKSLDELIKLSGTPKNLATELDREPMWDIPFLNSSSASDDEVSKALEQVKSMQGLVEQLQSSMWEDVVNFVRQTGAPEAESKGAEVRNLLAELAEGMKLGDQRGIGRNASQLEAAAGLR